MKFIHPPNILKSKIGSGGIDEQRLARAEKLIEEGDIGFPEYILQQREILLESIAVVSKETDTALEQLLLPVMSLKAHGKMFGYNLVSELSIDVLHLLEHIKVLNQDSLDILAVYERLLKTIADKELKADGGSVGKVIADELNAACERYFDKYKNI